MDSKHREGLLFVISSIIPFIPLSPDFIPPSYFIKRTPHRKSF